MVNDVYSDFFARLRRRKVMSLAAEIQWDLQPPLTFAAARVVITGARKPAYEIGEDTFHCAVTGDSADLLVLDSAGHGLPAALLASAAVGAYRHARREDRELPEISVAMDEVVRQQFATGSPPPPSFDLIWTPAQLPWINAGHPAPLIVRRGSLVHPPPCPPSRPLGLQDGKPFACKLRLKPGDSVLLTSMTSWRPAHRKESSSANTAWPTSLAAPPQPGKPQPRHAAG